MMQERDIQKAQAGAEEENKGRSRGQKHSRRKHNGHTLLRYLTFYRINAKVRWPHPECTYSLVRELKGIISYIKRGTQKTAKINFDPAKVSIMGRNRFGKMTGFSCWGSEQP